MSYKAKGILSKEHRKNLSLSHLGQIPANKIFISKKELKELYIDKNLTSVQIAKRFKCSYQTIVTKLKKYNILLKTISIGTKAGMDNKKILRKMSKIHKGKHRSIKTEFKKGHKIIKRKIKLVNHHIYLRENSTKTIKLNNKKHIKLHYQAYRYLVEIGLVDKYLKWFDKKYGLN